MADFLRVNGTPIPLETGSAKRTNTRDASERSVGGGPLTSRLGTYNVYTFKTTLLSPAEEVAVRNMFEGPGSFNLLCGGTLFDDVDTRCEGRVLNQEHVTQNLRVLDLELSQLAGAFGGGT